MNTGELLAFLFEGKCHDAESTELSNLGVHVGSSGWFRFLCKNGLLAERYIHKTVAYHQDLVLSFLLETLSESDEYFDTVKRLEDDFRKEFEEPIKFVCNSALNACPDTIAKTRVFVNFSKLNTDTLILDLNVPTEFLELSEIAKLLYEYCLFNIVRSFICRSNKKAKNNVIEIIKLFAEMQQTEQNIMDRFCKQKDDFNLIKGELLGIFVEFCKYSSGDNKSKYTDTSTDTDADTDADTEGLWVPVDATIPKILEEFFEFFTQIMNNEHFTEQENLASTNENTNNSNNMVMEA